MKKLISVMIALMLIVSCLPLTVSAAKETSIEQKFRLLLDDMEIAYAYHQPDSYYYEELAHMDTWTLICGGMNDLNPSNQAHKMHYATAGNKLIASNTVSEPFKSGFGVFDSRSGAFYDLTDAWERDFPGLLDAWNNLPSSEWVRGECSAALIGDADGDGKVNILDATRIQRIIAKLDADHTANPTKEDFFYGWPIGSVCDYDRDGKLTVLDATSIQRKLVSLPKVLEFNTLCCCPTDAYSASPAEPSAARILRTSAEEFGFTNRYGDNSYDLTLFHDDPSFHEKSVLVGAFVRLPDENDRVKSIDRVSLGTDGVLTVDLTYGKGSGESGYWMILLGITRAFVDDIRDVKVNITRENPFGTSVIAPITAERPNVPDDLNADGYHAIDPEFLNYAVPDSLVYNYPYPEPMQEPAHVGDGYLMLLRSRSDLDCYLPGFAESGKLSDAFFSEYAVLAAFVISDREHSFIELSDVAVYNGTTLCADTRIETNNWGAFDDDDMYDLVDETIWSLYKVKQSEVRDVDNLVCWGRNITALSAAITPQEERASAADILSTTGSSVALEPNVMTLVDGSRNVLDIDKYGYIACRFETGKNYLSLIRSRSEFCDHFYAFDEDGVYTDEFFKDNALIAVYGQGDCTDAAPTLSDVAVIDGTTLYADAQIAYPHPEDPFGDTEPFVWLFAQVKQSDVKNVDTIALWNSAETTAVVAQIPKRDRITVEIPDDPAAEGYTELSAEPITVPGPRNDYEEDYWNELIPAPELNDIDGYLLLIPDRAALERCLPGFDQQGQYDDAFFADYAIVGMIGQGTEENDTAELDYIAVKGDTLYARAYIQSHYETDEYGQPVMMPSAPIVRTFRRVSKSDVEGVTRIAFWRYTYPAIGSAITNVSVIETYDVSLSRTFDPEQNAQFITGGDMVGPAIGMLYVDDNGEPVERDDHIFTVEKWNDYEFNNQSVIALRVYADDFQKETFSVTGVKRTGENELTVSIQKRIPADHDLNEGVRFIFIAIPNYGKKHTVKVNITDIYENYNGFKVNFYTDEVTGKKAAGIRGYVGDNPHVTIPDHFGDYTVTTIKSGAFAGNTTIESVMIPDTVTAIQENAFKDCVNLKRVSVPLSVKEIPNFAFKSCKNLLNVNFYPAQDGSAALTLIGNSAFHSCESLSYFLIPDSVTRIRDYAFARCKSLKSVTFPQGIKEIGNGAFGLVGEGFTIYGYKNTVAQRYAEDYGFAFVPLDGTGDLAYDVIDCRYPSAKMTYPAEAIGLYVTSPAELAAALDELYTDVEGVSRRADDPEAYTAETLDDEWFKTHDLIAVRVEKNRGYGIWINGITADVGNKILVSLIHDYNGSDPGFEIDPNLDNTLCFLMLGIDKRDLTDGEPVVTVNVSYYPEPLKPIIYLYPEQETELTVTLGKPGELTCTYPAYNGGWHITAKPDGTLIGDSGRSYYALYWESKSKTPVSTPDGFVVKGEDAASFLEEKLAILGLSEREAQEFIVYWLPQMQDNAYNFIRFASADEIERIMPLSFSVQPDSVIRILMEYMPLDAYIEVPEQTLTTPERRGFVAVEWGGTLIGQ